MILIVFHNLSGYDSHLFIREIATCFKGRVSLLPQTKEKYISFTKFVEGTDINLSFIDSFKFMASSLDKLASYLEKLNTLERLFKEDGLCDEQILLLKRKGVFPYDYVSSFDKLKEPNLPSKDDFFSSYITLTSVMSIISMLKMFGRVLTFKSLGNTLTYISRQTLYCWLKFLKL